MSSANAKQLLLLLVVAVALSSLLAVDGRRRPVHLRLYMHDVIGGPERTAIRLIWGAGPAHKSMPGRSFGDTVAIDDLVTEGPDSSTVVVAGRDRIYDETRELAVVGGTGRLREAAGYVLWTTAKVLSDIHMVLELDEHATVRDNNPAAASRAGHSSSSHSSLAMATATASDKNGAPSSWGKRECSTTEYSMTEEA
ncbi:hypothetical protein EJB05_40813, partial [Eragrostis curvula]